MASMIGEGLDIDYSITDGKVRTFLYFDKHYREDGKNLNGYTDDQIDDALVALIKRAGWNIDYGRGWHKFVLKLASEKKLDLYGLKKVETPED